MNFYKKYIVPRLLNKAMREPWAAREREQLIPQARGVVLEVGIGTGLSLPLYRQDITKLYALEPSAERWALAADFVQAVTFPVEHLAAGAEAIPLPEASVDTVVSTWTMCSMDNPGQALSEIRRVLKPEGQFLFVEHGQARDTSVARWQTRLTPLWNMMTDGCHLDRPVAELLQEGGFSVKALEMAYAPIAGRLAKLLHFTYKGIATPRV